MAPKKKGHVYSKNENIRVYIQEDLKVFRSAVLKDNRALEQKNMNLGILVSKFLVREATVVAREYLG